MASSLLVFIITCQKTLLHTFVYYIDQSRIETFGYIDTEVYSISEAKTRFFLILSLSILTQGRGYAGKEKNLEYNGPKTSLPCHSGFGLNFQWYIAASAPNQESIKSHTCKI